MSSTPLPGAQRKATHLEPEEHNQRTQPEEHTQRTQIVLLPSDESALDLFASESDRLDVPAPSPAAGTAQPAITFAASSIPDPTIEPIRTPAIETIRDYPIDPIEDYQIDSARNIAIEPIRQYVRHGSMHTPGTRLLQGCAIFVGLALGVSGGGLAGFYLRRNPLELAIVRLPVADAANQAAIAGPTPETASPGTNGDAGTAAVNEARTIPSETGASTLTETPVPVENLSPPVVPPAPMPPPPASTR
jgi:hypothetical protein